MMKMNLEWLQEKEKTDDHHTNKSKQENKDKKKRKTENKKKTKLDFFNC